MPALIQLLRPKHCVKNILILLPLVFGGQLMSWPLLWKTLAGFAAFSLLSSAIYILNDLKDVDSDRRHPHKCRRPIASGKVNVKTACALMIVVFLLALLCNLLAAGREPLPWLMLLTYAGLNAAYSFGLKNVAIVDVAILVSGFLLRVLYGSTLTGIAISNWLYLTVVAGSFFLGLGKRRNELKGQPCGETRKVLRQYNTDFLSRSMYMCLTLAITFYSLWTADVETTARLGSNGCIWTVPVVILICMKYSLTIEGQSDGDPVEVLFGDRTLLFLTLLLALLFFGIIYGKSVLQLFSGT